MVADQTTEAHYEQIGTAPPPGNGAAPAPAPPARSPRDLPLAEQPLVDLDEIHAAAERISGRNSSGPGIAGTAVRTPLMRSPWPGLWLKPEMLQPVGAFKIRGALNAIANLDPELRARGVLAHSSGNHAPAVAYAARAFGVDAYIVIPDNAPARKVDATRALGATVELVPVEQRFSRPEEIARETGKPLVAPFDDRDVIAGQGTIGLEIAEDVLACAGRPPWAEPPAAILVPVSGGGLISGNAAALAALLPGTAVIGVEPELAGDAAESFHTGRRGAWTPDRTTRTIADGLRSFSLGELPWRHISAQVADIITVTEQEILDATRMVALQARVVSEPSGAVGVAAHLFHSDQLPAGTRIAVASGGNIDPALLGRLLADG
jgi:threonine dehydratase